MAGCTVTFWTQGGSVGLYLLNNSQRIFFVVAQMSYIIPKCQSKYIQRHTDQIELHKDIAVMVIAEIIAATYSRKRLNMFERLYTVYTVYEDDEIKTLLIP